MSNVNGQFDRLSRNAMNIAENLSKSLGHTYIGSEHLVYGILSQDINSALIQINIKSPGENSFKLLLENIKINAKEVAKAQTVGTVNNPVFTDELKSVIDNAIMVAMNYGFNKITIEHLFFGILVTPFASAKKILHINEEYANEMTEFFILHFEENIRKEKTKLPPIQNNNSTIRNENPAPNGNGNNKGPNNKKQSILDMFGTNLVEKYKKNPELSITGREKELESIILTLSRKTKNNPIITGEPGVGKTALVELLANKIANKDVPEWLQDKLIYSIDISSILAGSIFRGEFEQKLKNLISETIQRKNIILFIDELHTVIGAGTGMDKGLDMSNILKPHLARGEVTVIGATTSDEYRTIIKKDKAFERRFQPIHIDEPSADETKMILVEIKASYEKFHNVEVSTDVTNKIVDLTSKYLPSRYFPDKALDVLDEICALRKFKNKKGNKIVTIEDVNTVISKMTGVPVEKLNESIFSKLVTLDKKLNTQVFGQEDAVERLTKALKRSYSGVSYHTGPIASFIFLGPSGVGKTQLVKALSNELFADGDKSMLKVDMSELSEKHSISRLVGTTAGYVGYDDAPQLTEFLRKKPNCIILFDEIEKGHPQILNLLLQMLEDGYVTDGKGEKISCKDSIIILTSNIGISQFNAKAKNIGFANPNHAQQSLIEFKSTKSDILEQLQKQIKPEILGRLSDKIVFNPINFEIIEEIVKHEIKLLNKNMEKQGKVITVQPQITKHIAQITSKNLEYGARDLKKVIQDVLLDPLSEYVLSHQKAKGITAKLTKENQVILELTPIKLELDPTPPKKSKPKAKKTKEKIVS
jgi:ATP-dependent Clp protease ATP-binding subunit ClpC